MGRWKTKTVPTSSSKSSEDEAKNAAILMKNRKNLTRLPSDDNASCHTRSLCTGSFDEDDEIIKTKVMSAHDDLDNLLPPDDRKPTVINHPALDVVSVMDCATATRIIPNGTAYPLINDCFEGSVMLLMRTPDVDNPRDSAVLGPTQQGVSEYFKGKKRRFEFQFQIKLKRIPTGPLFLGCELEQGIKVGGLTKGLVGILLAMVRRINPGFHYSWGPGDANQTSAESIEAGNYEKTHLSFPVEASMDRIVITKPGEEPPTLGEELHESAESVKRRRRQGGGCVDWNLENTYTMCLWSAYADWIKWRSINVPGVSPFNLSRVTGTQPIYLSVYEMPNYDNAEYKRKRPPHMQKELHIYTRLEFSHDERTKGGYANGEVIKNGRTMDLQSLPDTESVGSDLETLSRVSHITN